jgi:hypothetical protein
VTRPSGSGQAELRDAAGKPLAGFTLEDCRPIVGDHIDHQVSWKGGRLATLAGKPVRLRLVLKDADVFALQFC